MDDDVVFSFVQALYLYNLHFFSFKIVSNKLKMYIYFSPLAILHKNKLKIRYFFKIKNLLAKEESTCKLEKCHKAEIS